MGQEGKSLRIGRLLSAAVLLESRSDRPNSLDVAQVSLVPPPQSPPTHTHRPQGPYRRGAQASCYTSTAKLSLLR